MPKVMGYLYLNPVNEINMLIQERKAELRKMLLAQRDNFPLHEKTVKDKEICERIEQLVEELGAKVIHTYLPFGSEIDIYPLIERLLEKGMTVICPKALPKRVLENRILTSLNELEEGRFGTKHPADPTVYTGNIDLFIVPGISFNQQNFRLGYGAGYYDTFFAGHPGGYKLGVCYPFQVGDFPVEPHDVPLDGVIS